MTVTEATGLLAAEPSADLELDMVDFEFVLSALIASGSQTIGVTNSGDEDHELIRI